MTVKRLLAVLLFVMVLGGTFAGSKPTDFDVLRKAGETTAATVKAALPATAKLTAPLAAFRAGDALPVEERVRLRIRTDKLMAGADVSALATPTLGQVRLTGTVLNATQRKRAIDLAQATAGVEVVVEEMAGGS